MLPFTLLHPIIMPLLIASSLLPLPPGRGVVPVTVALVTTLPDASARAVIILRAGDGKDVVLLRDQAAVTDLAAALALLDRTRRHEGRPAVRDRQVILRDARIERPLSPSLQRRLQAQLRRLQTAAEREVEGVGRVRAIDVRSGGRN